MNKSYYIKYKLKDSFKSEIKYKNIEKIEIFKHKYLKMETQNVGDSKNNKQENENQKQIIFLEEENSLDFTFFLYLAHPPKMFKRLDQFQLLMPVDNYMTNFNEFISLIPYTNHYHFYETKKKNLINEFELKPENNFPLLKNSKKSDNKENKTPNTNKNVEIINFQQNKFKNNNFKKQNEKLIEVENEINFKENLNYSPHLNKNEIESQNSMKKELVNIEVEHLPSDRSKFRQKRPHVDFSSQPNNDDFFAFNRIDSFLSCPNEYGNFYLLNLIVRMNFSFKNFNEFKRLIELFKAKNIEIIIHNDENEKMKTEITNYSEMSESQSKFFHKILAEKIFNFYQYFVNFHFSLQYMILSLITTKRIKIFYFDFSFFKKIPLEDCEAQETAAVVLENILKQHNKLDSYCFNFAEIFSLYFCNSTIKVDIIKSEEIIKEVKDQDMMKIRTILVTPSLIYYKPPANEKINHILRKFVDYKENFIKVNFVDEDQSKFFFCTPNVHVLLDFLKINMLDGIKVGTRHFNFLSASNSQMKNSSYWFFNLEGTRFVNIEQIIRNLGDFTKEHNIHKNAARRGQFLSTTSLIKELKEEQIKIIPDIKGPKGIFTDGIGQISLDLALESANKFKYDFASAFQIRIGGVKGIVAINPKLEGQIIKVRPSMIKFESEHRELGVIRCSSYSQGFLNRQIIILLYSLGVPKSVFLKMLEKDISRYDYLTKKPNKALIENNQFANDYLKKCYYFAPAVDSYVCNNLNLLNDPILCTIVKTIAISRILDLKLKGKIMDKFSAVLLGVIDETNTLEEGEVYINIRQDNCSPYKNSNYSENNASSSGVIEGNILVTKNPCLHPGDIKILRAVSLKSQNFNNPNNFNNNPLYHMINVIVFSSKGERPVQNEISGGDLDGDSYFVSWNRDLLKSIKLKNIASMEDPKNESEKSKLEKEIVKQEIKMKDIVNSYIEYMKNDTIAMIANYHIMLADKDLEKGAFNKECLRLANLFSIAIDAPKHGNFISIDQVYAGKRPTEYPDFLEVGVFSTYKSPGVIGELYRLIDNNSYINEYKYTEYMLYYCEDYLIQPFFLTDNYYKHLKDAYKIYKEYNNEVMNLIETFKISSEAELFMSEFVNEKRKLKTNSNKTSDIIAEIVNLKSKYSNKVLKSFGNINHEHATAIYVATYLNNKSIIENKECKISLRCLKEFIDILIADGRIDSNIYNVKNFENILKNKLSFEKFYDKKNNKFNGGGRNPSIGIHLRTFSLPFFLKEVRDKLFRYK